MKAIPLTATATLLFNLLFSLHAQANASGPASPPWCILSCVQTLSTSCSTHLRDMPCLCEKRLDVFQCIVDTCPFGNFLPARDHYLGTCIEQLPWLKDDPNFNYELEESCEEDEGHEDVPLQEGDECDSDNDSDNDNDQEQIDDGDSTKDAPCEDDNENKETPPSDDTDVPSEDDGENKETPPTDEAPREDGDDSKETPPTDDTDVPSEDGDDNKETPPTDDTDVPSEDDNQNKETPGDDADPCEDGNENKETPDDGKQREIVDDDNDKEINDDDGGDDKQEASQLEDIDRNKTNETYNYGSKENAEHVENRYNRSLKYKIDREQEYLLQERLAREDALRMISNPKRNSLTHRFLNSSTPQQKQKQGQNHYINSFDQSTTTLDSGSKYEFTESFTTITTTSTNPETTETAETENAIDFQFATPEQRYDNERGGLDDLGDALNRDTETADDSETEQDQLDVNSMFARRRKSGRRRNGKNRASTRNANRRRGGARARSRDANAQHRINEDELLGTERLRFSSNIFTTPGL